MVTLIHIPKGNGKLFIMATTPVHIQIPKCHKIYRKHTILFSVHSLSTWKSFDNIFFSLHFTLKAVSSSVAQTQTKFFSLPFWQTLFFYEIRRQSRLHRSVSSTFSISYIFPKDNLSTSGLMLRTLRILRYEQQQQNSYSCILSVPVTPSFGSMLFGWLAPSNRAFHFKLETT